MNRKKEREGERHKQREKEREKGYTVKRITTVREVKEKREFDE